MPPALHSFYNAHGEWLKEHAPDADLRKHTVPEEGPRHYIDFDRYATEFDSITALFPMAWEEALERWNEDSIRQHGIGPWHAIRTYHNLVFAFEAQDEPLILRYSVDLAHYIADLHVPLHTTSNYNGQLTNQVGIHALWETQVPERWMASYDLAPPVPGKSCNWIPDVSHFVWNFTIHSHALVPEVLEMEMRTREALGPNEVDAYIPRGRTRTLMRTDSFVQHFNDQLNGQVERRMHQSVEAVAHLWFSAWVDAGQPVMPQTRNTSPTRWKKFLDWIFK